MYRTLVILRHTFLEAVVQPIYAILLILAAVVLAVFGLLPFFTLGEDTLMYKAVGLDMILMAVLIATLFATSRSIYDEIEDRTMLTLMSKPLHKWEVLVGKYLGIILSSLLAVAVLGVVLCLCTWRRIPEDYMLRGGALDDLVRKEIAGYWRMHLMGLVPALLHVWLEVSVLAAVGVALSTRFALVVNLPVVILVYLAGNLTRFLYPLLGDKDRSLFVKAFAYLIGLFLPMLEAFDLRPLTVYSHIKVAQFAADPSARTVGEIWRYLGVSAAYGIVYSIFALSLGMWLFQSRELGGAEG